MANYLLKPVFRSVFNKEFQPELFEDRLEMQKVIYLLQNRGISVGNYNFMWYKHGPYSQTLQNDIWDLYGTDDIDVDVDFSVDAKREICALKKAVFKACTQYDLCQWVECLGSLQYIKENILPSSADDASIIDELKQRKPHLNVDRDNEVALQTIKELAM